MGHAKGKNRKSSAQTLEKQRKSMGKYLANELSQEPVIYLSSVGAHAVHTGYARGTHVVRTWGWDRPGDRDR